SARPCDEHGNFIPEGTLPPPLPERAVDDYAPFEDCIQFETADFIYTDNQMSAGHFKKLNHLWAATSAQKQGQPPFRNTKEMHEIIDNISLGDVRWKTATIWYKLTESDRPGPHPNWKTQDYKINYRDPHAIVRNLLANHDFDGEFDYTPIRDQTRKDGLRRRDFMSGDWAWDQADLITEDEKNHGSMFVPLILGSDKTTVSVATGQNEYYPLYMSIENVHNNVRRAHRNAVVVIGFFAMPKSSKDYAKDPEFRKFKRKLYHGSLIKIFQSLKKAMTKYEVFRCPDGHFRRVIFGLGPFIGDYPEQVLVTSIVQGWCPKCTAASPNLESSRKLPRTREYSAKLAEKLSFQEAWDNYGIAADIEPYTDSFPRADIHELVAPDILHQLIKGTFKDHIITWVEEYIKLEHGTTRASAILADIDRRMAVVPPFTGLRRFPEGSDFKQWTGDDSKALMKVILPALLGYVPDDMVRALAAFLDFCYIARRNVHTDKMLAELDDALQCFHKYQNIFQTSSVRPDGFALPRQHSLVHYRELIELFGAPNGLCSSITKSKHIKAVKKPWRRSNRYKALIQMLKINQRLDKLAAARIEFKARGMLEGTLMEHVLSQFYSEEEDLGDLPGPRVMNYVDIARTRQSGFSREVSELAAQIKQPRLEELLRRFLYDQTHPDAPYDSEENNVDPKSFRSFMKKRIWVHYSAAATYYAPSDPCGVGGMHCEHIRASPSWFGGPPRFDCVFVNQDSSIPGIRGLGIAQVLLFCSFKHLGETYSCALVHWHKLVGDAPDNRTGMWIAQPDFLDNARKQPLLQVIHTDSIVRAAHLIPVFTRGPVPPGVEFHNALYAYGSFHVNKYVDHHAFETIF
ncbi:hypothetical protein CERSUDRAFT_56026, partial [Gelatoporia subvermispora B]